ncbi:REF/SRPP-like protein At1g67360 [Impatiens glandulifera]|uniref:REF/SRPP-like protein At1g67360 n=1 Tax=Impatiens glandulifera TaxID=253017 RepID=UPI001FB0617F|nr:REF/SRPP-like protein At1g67360 [Impatiens glandulifera]
MESDRVMIEKKDHDHELKHLQFVTVIALNAFLCASNLYDCAKRNSGSFKTRVNIVENTVISILRPVYDKFKGVPYSLLLTLDLKVDEVVKRIEECVPRSAKQGLSKAQSIAVKTSKEAKMIAKEVEAGGLSAAIQHAASLYRQLLVIILVRSWYWTNKVTWCHVIAQMVLPCISQWTQTYNKTVYDLSSCYRYYGFFKYVPLVPVDEIAKSYKLIEVKKGPACVPCFENKIWLM